MGIDSADDYYGLLGIDAAADGAELRRAWHRLALRWHTDRAGPGAKARFQKILAAYMVLSDPVDRAAYDRRRGAPARRPGMPLATSWARRPPKGVDIPRQSRGMV